MDARDRLITGHDAEMAARADDDLRPYDPLEDFAGVLEDTLEAIKQDRAGTGFPALMGIKVPCLRDRLTYLEREIARLRLSC